MRHDLSDNWLLLAVCVVFMVPVMIGAARCNLDIESRDSRRAACVNKTHDVAGCLRAFPVANGPDHE